MEVTQISPIVCSLNDLRPDWEHMKQLKQNHESVHGYVLSLLEPPDGTENYFVFQNIVTSQIFNYKIFITFNSESTRSFALSGIQGKHASIRFYDPEKPKLKTVVLDIDPAIENSRIRQSFQQYGEIERIERPHFIYNDKKIYNGNIIITYKSIKKSIPTTAKYTVNENETLIKIRFNDKIMKKCYIKIQKNKAQSHH